MNFKLKKVSVGFVNCQLSSVSIGVKKQQSKLISISSKHTMNQIEDSIEAPITSLADEDIMQGYDEEDAEVEQPQNNESMNHFYNINRFVIVAIGAFSAFLGIGLVLEIPMAVVSHSLLIKVCISCVCFFFCNNHIIPYFIAIVPSIGQVFAIKRL